MFPCLRVVCIVLVAVGLLPKAHAVIGLVVRVAWLLPEAPAEKANDVLGAIPRTKRTPNRLTALKPLTGIRPFLMIFTFPCL